MPAIWAYTNELEFYQSSSSSSNRRIYDLYGTIDSLQNVVYKHTKRSDGKFWIEILLDGELKNQYENTTPTCMENMKFYASNPWDDPTPVTIDKFKIITGKLDFYSIKMFEFLLTPCLNLLQVMHVVQNRQNMEFMINLPLFIQFANLVIIFYVLMSYLLFSIIKQNVIKCLYTVICTYCMIN